jgi:hypothetical protein
MPDGRVWVWTDALAAIWEGEGTGGVDARPLIGYAIEEGRDVIAFAREVLGRENADDRDAAQLMPPP